MSLRTIELLPGADIHLAIDARFDQLTFRALLHDDTAGPTEVTAPALRFEIDGVAGPPVNGWLDDGKIRVNVDTGVLEAVTRDAGDPRSFLRVLFDDSSGGGAAVTWRVPVRVVVHENFPEIWIANNYASVMAGSDFFIPTVYAESAAGTAVDISGHGFVAFSLTGDAGSSVVNAVTGRITAGIGDAGKTLHLRASLNGASVGDLDIAVKPPPDEQPNESDSVKAMREVVEELPFTPGAGSPRRNILLVAEGFTQHQQRHFRTFATRFARRLRKRRVHEPFRLLREDYRIWTAFIPSPQNGISINTRINEGTGAFGDIKDLDPTRRLFQLHDTPMGLAYGRRAGEIPFLPEPPKNAPPQTAAQEWDGFDWESRQILKDWRKTGLDRTQWHRSAIAWLSSLRKKGGSPSDADYRIGEKWGPGGQDQGLVMAVVNDQVNAGTYTRGEPDYPGGFLFGAVSLGKAKDVTVQNASPQFDHEPSNVQDSGDYNNRMARLLVAIHELAHGIFLGDEYEDTHNLGQHDQRTLLPLDNLDTFDWIAADGVTKWEGMPRVVKSSTLAALAQVSAAGRIEVELMPGEGAIWGVNQTVRLQTRNINRSSASHDSFLQYPEGRAHPYLQSDSLTITAVTGDRLSFSGASLQVGQVFPAGSMLFEPANLSLVLPGVLAAMAGKTTPLHSKAGACARADEHKTVFPSAPAGSLGVIEPRKRQQLIGLYEGGGQMNCKAYRPTGECMMRNEFEIVQSLASDKYFEVRKFPFCHVCRYVIVNEFNPSRHAELDELYPGEPVP
ncbi:MAG: hypothetical protein H6509_00745 [Bryobacterales bacterium]|nr:hypothetical protein [Bryobacterales bacterium]